MIYFLLCVANKCVRVELKSVQIGSELRLLGPKLILAGLEAQQH
jgi:hypothetical protein